MASDHGAHVHISLFDRARTAEQRVATLERQLAEAKGELSEIDSTLDSVTKCVAKTRADRIRDSFKHSALVTDAVIFDCEKQEQSARAQVIYWMGMAKAAADQLAEAKGEVERLRKLYNGAGEAMNRLKSFGLSDEQWREYLDLDGKSPVQTLEAARAEGAKAERERLKELVALIDAWIAGHPCDCECGDCRRLSDWLMEHAAAIRALDEKEAPDGDAAE